MSDSPKVLKLYSPYSQNRPESIRPNAEVTPRDPHERRYLTEGRYLPLVVKVNRNGVVKVSEELLHFLLAAAGWSEVIEHTDGSR